MEDNRDIRWKQRFQNFERAFLLFKSAIEEYGDTENELIKEGIIQRFEYTHELTWNVMKDFMIHEGFVNITGSRSAVREAFHMKLISNGNDWMAMIET